MVKIVYRMLAFCLTLSLPLCAELKSILERALPALQHPIGGSMHKELQTELLDMAQEDEEVRNLCLSDGNWSRLEKIDQKHNPRLKEIVAEFGWPGIQLVGLEGSRAMWLLVQHQDIDLEFQKECLVLLKEATQEQKAHFRDYAYLLDRVCMNSGEPQVYGTQWIKKEEELVLYPVSDPDQLEQRRLEAGLCSLADYKEQLQSLYGKK